VNTRFDRVELEGLLSRKGSRGSLRLASSTIVQHEFRGQFGHPSSYAFVQFECAPADDLSFQVRASWPPEVLEGEAVRIERAIAKGIADVLLNGVNKYSGCAVVLVTVRWNEVGSSETAFMKAAILAMQNLLTAEWTFTGTTPKPWWKRWSKR